MADLGRIQWRAPCITPAATWTDGPSRPADRPANMVAAPSPILARVSRNETKRRRATEFTWGSMAAMTWECPNLRHRENRRVVQTMPAVSVGVQFSTAQGWALFRC